MRVTLTDDQLSALLRKASIGLAKIEAIVADATRLHAVKTPDEEVDGVAMAVASAIGSYKDKLREARNDLAAVLREAGISEAGIEAIVAEVKRSHAMKVTDKDENEVTTAAASAMDSCKDKLWEACRDPITEEVMDDAVIVNAPCKHMVKMTTFQEWVGNHGNKTCPSCGSPLWSTGVMPNKPLREVIEILQGGVAEVSVTAARSVTPTPPESPQQPAIRFLDDGECGWGNYVGELNDQGQRHGHGVMEWEEGSRYEGDWENDSKEGKGKMAHSDGDVYEGEFKEDWPEGRGKYIFPGSIVEGTFIKGELDGIATETYTDGTMSFCRFMFGSKVEGVCWSGNWMEAKRLWWNSSGRPEHKSVSLEEAASIATRLGVNIPEPSTGLNM